MPSFWPCVGASVPFPTPLDPPLGVGGATVSAMTDYIRNLTAAGSILTSNPLSFDDVPAVDFGPVGTGSVNVKSFGALGDGGTEDTAAVQRAFDYVRDIGGGEVFFPAGTYPCKSVFLYSGVSVRGVGDASILKQLFVAGSNEMLSAGSIYYRVDAGHAATVVGIKVSDIQLLGTVATDGFSEFVGLMSIAGGTDILIERVSFVGFRGDGIQLMGKNLVVPINPERHNENITIRKCFFDGVNNDNRQGISIIDGKGVLVEDCRFVRTCRSSMPGAIDLEPDEVFSKLQNITIRNNTFDGCGGGVGVICMYQKTPQGGLTYPVYGIDIDGNTITNTSNWAITVFHNQNADATVYPSAVAVRNNKILSTAGAGMQLKGVRGLTVENNRVECDGFGAGIGGQNDTSPIWGNTDVRMVGNYFYRTDSVLIGQNNNILIDGNTFVGLGNASTPGFNYALSFGLAVSTANVTVSRNKVLQDGLTNNFIAQEGSHVTTEATNLEYGNELNGLTNTALWQPARTDQIRTSSVVVDVTSISPGNTYVSTDIVLVGAAVGDYVYVSASIDLLGLVVGGYVKSAGVVKFTLQNGTSAPVDLVSATYYLKVVKR
jgi:Pectate lyase superfamily protein/Right handed beta helix region